MSAVFGSPNVSAVPVQSQSPAQPKNYLNACTKQVDPKAISEASRKSILWKVAACTSAIALAILSLGAYVTGLVGVLTGVLMPGFIFVGIAVAAGLGFAAAKVFEKCMKQANTHESFLKKSKELVVHHTPLKNMSAENLQAHLAQRGIAWQEIPGMTQNPEALKSLTPIIARLDLLQSRLEKLTQERESKIAELNRLIVSANPTINRPKPEIESKIFDLRLDIVCLAGTILRSKIEVAFANAAIYRPGFNGVPFDAGLFQWCDISHGLSAIADGNPNNNLFYFNKQGLAPITRQEASDASIADLRVRVLASA